MSYKGLDPFSWNEHQHELRRLRHTLPSKASGEPPDDEPMFRGIVPLDSGYRSRHDQPISLEAAQDLAVGEVWKYLAQDDPEEVLVLALPAGSGKTFVAREVAETVVTRSTRKRMIGFLMPTKQMTGELIASSSRPDLFYDWQARQAASADGSRRETCKHAGPIQQFQEKGYPALDFCTSVHDCGRDYVKFGCVYHGQSREVEALGARIVVGQHAHLAFGHPMWEKFDVLIGDESPMNAIPHVWAIPYGAILPADPTPLGADLSELVWKLQTFAERGERLFGRTLVDALGGPDVVLRAVGDRWLDPEQAKPWNPHPHRPEEVANLDYFHVPWLAALLRQEARALRDGLDPVPRVLIDTLRVEKRGQKPIAGLVLLKRHRVLWRDPQVKDAAGWPRHTIWLDATADQRFYERIFQRPVRIVRPWVEARHHIFQVHSRANGIASLYAVDDQEEALRAELGTPNGTPAKGGDDLVKMVEWISYVARRDGKKLGIICFKRMKPLLEQYADVNPRTGKPMIEHFGNLRGSNNFVEADWLVVAGTPHPPPDDIERTAICLLTPERVESFRDRSGKLPRSVVLKPYDYVGPDGEGFGYPTPGFWSEPDLQSVLEQGVDAELVQAVYRIRGVRRESGNKALVILLSNRPVDGIGPNHLMSMGELFMAPTGDRGQPLVDPFEWERFFRLSEKLMDEQGWVSTGDVVRELNVSRSTAAKYVDWLIETFPGFWKHPAPEEQVALARQRGARGRTPSHLAMKWGFVPG